MVARPTPIDPQHAWTVLERLHAAQPEQRLALLDTSELDEGTRGFVREVLGRGLGGTTASDASRLPGVRARYRLGGLLGEGGYGQVYLARSTRPPKRVVAVKVLRSGLDSSRILRRFEGEQQALARLDHPGIAGIFESGVTDEGRPFFAMPLVLGETILRHCDRERSDVRERVRLFREVVDAVAHAHRRGVLHRDLKPSNLIVAAGERGPRATVIDFGIAKSLDEPLSEHTFATEDGTVVGTPEYMSPEQADGLPEAADVRSDVFALGVILYELLCSHLPIDRETLRRGGTSRIGSTIRSTVAVSPSRRVGLDGIRLEGGESTPWRRRGLEGADELVAALRGNLDAICMKAMAKDQADRYVNADALLADLDRHLEGDAVLARQHSWRDSLRGAIRRHRTAVAVALAVALALAVGLVSTLTFAFQSMRQSEARRQAATRAEAFAGFLGGIFAGLDPEQAKGKDTVLLELMLEDAAESLAAGSELDGDPLDAQIAANLHLVLGIAYLRLARLEPAEFHLTAAADGFAARRSPGEAPSASEIDALFELATLRMTQYRDDEAIEVANRCLEVLGWPQDPDAILDRRAMLMLAKFGKIAAAFDGDRLSITEGRGEPVEFSRRVAALARSRFGDDDPLTLKVLGQHGRVLEQSGHRQESIAVLEDTVARSSRINGRGHPDTLQAVLYLTVAYSDASNVPLIEVWLDDFEQTYGPDHPMVANLLLNYGSGLRRQERFEEARIPLHAALNRFARKFGPTHPMTVWTENTLLYTLEALQLDEEAEAILVARYASFAGEPPMNSEDLDSFDWWREWFRGWSGREAAIAPEHLAALGLND